MNNAHSEDPQSAEDARLKVLQATWELHYGTIATSNDPQIGYATSQVYRASQGLLIDVIAVAYAITPGQARKAYEWFIESGEVLATSHVMELLAEDTSRMQEYLQ